MQINHLYVDGDGESHWRTTVPTLTERSFAPPASDIHISDAEPVRALVFLRLAAGWNEPIHPTPKRQTLICLAGAVKVTTSDGEARVIGPGDVWRMEDTHGRGHHTQVVSREDFEAAVVQDD
ncbi:MAG: cupin [Pseudomonadota bacterium]